MRSITYLIRGRARCGRAFGATLMLAALAACAAPAGPARRAAASPAAAPAAALATESPLGSYLAALHAQHTHDYKDAAQLMEKALADDPNNMELVRRTFVFRVSEGRVGAAVPLARRIVDLDGNSGLPALVLLAEDIKAGKFDAAAERAASLERGGPQRLVVPLLAAWIAAARHDGAGARAALKEMGDLQGLEPLRQLHLAMLDDYLGDIDGAARAYDAVIAAQPQPTYRLVEAAGNFFERHGRAEDAARLYRGFIASDPESEIAVQGLERIKAGTIPAPLVASAQQGAADALFDFASVLNARDTLDAALIYARLALEIEPDFALAKLLAAEIRDDQGRTSDALALFRSVDPKSPLGWSARLRAALALDALGQTDAAISDLQAMAAERPQDRDCLIELGDVLRAHERYAEAAQAYNAALARPGKDSADAWRLYYDRGVAFERSGQWSKAEPDLKHALALSPDQPLVLNYLGYSWIDKGENLPEALKMIERAVELKPNDGYIVDSLGWAYYRLGNLAKATEFLERAIELLPEDPTINDHLGDAYWRDGRQREARYQWQRALQFGPEPADAKTIETKLDRGLGKAPQAVSGG